MPEVIFSYETKSRPVEIVLGYVSDSKRDIIVRQRKTRMRYVPGVKMSGCIS
jgi:hypothetical protein